ncbi:Biofilm development protein YmgB/AriR [Izhakiella capsodis]|uniref:Biofilm development protein YmgB/AriR n=1 Tax=Izhakiella capsodis TaxID=1367852 RepID=A0A1I4UUN5_9GAMM|nr:biofilm development regulator YmgB/AriR family protein [Izhakiella capsodis]SFM92490.1 Biofilm development protein YmgB/AriR [Izhakiella capsodis]
MTDMSAVVASHSTRIAEFFNESADVLHSESQVISQILAELSAHRSFVSNKDIISALLVRMEIEQEPVNHDILRKALEVVVQNTPDDTF